MSRNNEFNKLSEKIKQQENLINSQNQKIQSLETLESSNTKNKSLLLKISQHPAYVILTFISVVLSAIGGIPGLIQAKQSLFDKPELIFYPDLKAIGSPKTNLTSIFMTGSIANTGNVSINVARFEFYVLDGDVEYQGNSAPLPDTANFFGDGHVIPIVHGEELSINKLRLLSKDSPEKVNLLYLINLPKSKIFKNQNDVRFKIICFDLKNNKYIYEFPLIENNDNIGLENKDSTYYNPNGGIILYPENDSNTWR